MIFLLFNQKANQVETKKRQKALPFS